MSIVQTFNFAREAAASFYTAVSSLFDLKFVYNSSANMDYNKNSIAIVRRASAGVSQAVIEQLL